VPALGLTAASAGEIVLAARALFGSRPSIGRAFFARAVEASGEEAVELWRCCLEAGETISHYGLGYTLYGLGRYREAYRHLRHYAELAPQGSWSWCWYGRAAEALGLHGEARAAYREAIGLEEAGAQPTDARDLSRGSGARAPGGQGRDALGAGVVKRVAACPDRPVVVGGQGVRTADAVGLAIGTLLAAWLLLVGARIRARARREYIRLLVVPYRTDRAAPDAAVLMFEALHACSLQRWWRRALRGQGSIALELHALPRPAGAPTVVLAVACPAQLRERVEAALRTAYPNTALRPFPGRIGQPPCVLRLRSAACSSRASAWPTRVTRGIRRSTA
jgi:tetratricopeptide (TPR) repeat protein